MNQYVPITLDKTRNLRIGFKASDIIEATLKTPISKLNFDEMTMREMATVVYAGLVHEDKELTVDRVLDLMDEFGDIEELGEALGKALEIGFSRKNVQGAPVKK